MDERHWSPVGHGTGRRLEGVAVRRRELFVIGSKGAGVAFDRQAKCPDALSVLPMNLKTLRKKIRKLETRLQEGPAKLAKWKRKFAAMEKAQARKATRKLDSRAAGAARPSAKTSTSAHEKKGRSMARPPGKAVVAPKRKPARRAKRKLNLSPERRAQLAAAMRARWAAKRASSDQVPASGEVPQAP
jgi:hypothetical protein